MATVMTDNQGEETFRIREIKDGFGTKYHVEEWKLYGRTSGEERVWQWRAIGPRHDDMSAAIESIKYIVADRQPVVEKIVMTFDSEGNEL